jgi:hypothetical protein
MRRRYVGGSWLLCKTGSLSIYSFDCLFGRGKSRSLGGEEITTKGIGVTRRIHLATGTL